MKPLTLPLVPYLLVFILGVNFHFQETFSYQLLHVLLAMAILGFHSFKSPFYWRAPFWGLLFFCLGFCVAHIDQLLPEKHYANFAPTEVNNIEIELQQRLRGSTNAHRFYANLTSINGKSSEGRVLFQLKKDSSYSPLLVGDKLLIKDRLSPIQPPSNPNGFDYKEYLQSISIYHQLRTNSDAVRFLGHSKKPLIKIKNVILRKLDESSLNHTTKEILKTMLLGERSSLDANTMDQYANAGVVHLFAISGLHIGLLMLLFQWLLRPLRFLPHGHLIQLIGVLALLWCYAFFVGAAASVLRSVTLFSAYHIGMQSQRKTPTAYLVLLSMAIILFFEPRFILQLGFQMSYLAVFGILFLHPLMQLKLKHKALQWFWNLTTVSLSAQIAVAPISIYHFHQFPGLFLLSNWAILPFIGLFLYVGLGCIIWLLFFALPPPLVYLLDGLVAKMNQLVFWIGAQENFIFSSLVIDQLTLGLLYALLVCSVIWLNQKKTYWILLIGCFLPLLLWHLNISSNTTEQRFWIVHAYGETILVEKNGKQFTFHSNELVDENSFILNHFTQNFAHSNWTTQPLFNGYIIGDEQLYVIDNNWSTELVLQQKATYLLSKNPKINLERLLKKFSPKMIIIDGSNTPYYVEQWEKTLNKTNTAYHLTQKMGAYELTAKTRNEGF